MPPDLDDWNRIAAGYEEIRGAGGNIAYELMEDALWDSLGDVNGLHVLDLGCGSGWFSAELAARGARVMGVGGC